MRCHIYGCGSYAINENLFDRSIGIDSDLCDVHYWQKRAKDFEAQLANATAIDERLKRVAAEQAIKDARKQALADVAEGFIKQKSWVRDYAFAVVEHAAEEGSPK